MLLLLATVLALLLHDSFRPGYTLFSNDGPLGKLMSQCHRMPDAFTGVWQDLNTLGYREAGVVPSVTGALLWMLTPVAFSKFYALLALLILGLGAWTFFRQLGLAPPACILGGLAASLNSVFFSAACWGVGPQAITVGMTFLALAALGDTSSRRRWLRAALAGWAVGLGVAEGADIGAIFSLYVAAFVVYQAWMAEGPRAKTLAAGAGRLALVAGCAVFVAARSVSALVSTQIEGVAGMESEARTTTEHWDWATRWSLPKREALGLVVPGLFGYRMDTSGGGAYWGATGRDPAWDRYWAGGGQGPAPKGFLRFSGGGDYAGMLVVLLALWAVAQSFSRRDPIFSRLQRRWLWFWLAVGVVALLLAFGRFAPFYRGVYALPYFNTIRNPVKFLHILALALVVLFAYGVDGVWRKYMRPSGTAPKLPQWAIPKGWWAQATASERRWVWGCGLVLGASLLGWLIYSNSRPDLEQYLQSVRFDEATARAIAGFSVRQVGWFVLFFALAAGFLALIFRGVFTGARAGWGALGLGLLLVVDLGRADRPWIIQFNYQAVYASNPVIDRLRDQPYAHRVAILPFQGAPELPFFERAYRNHWLPLLFAYYNIQSLDYFQLPRMPEDLAAFDKTFNPAGAAEPGRLVVRHWQLTNTRYFLGAAALADSLDREIDPRFRLTERFNLVAKPGIQLVADWGNLTAAPTNNGPYALYEFTGALPRARLYGHWEIQTNDPAVLAQLASAAFDPEQSVLVADGPPMSTAAAGGAKPQEAGSVEFARYAPNDIALKATAAVPAVLLLNDRFDPHWQVQVDGRPAALLRCNYLMRGVFVGPGAHTVEFRFRPPVGSLWVSLAAMAVGLLLLGTLLVTEFLARSPAECPASAPALARPLPAPVSEPAGTHGGRRQESRHQQVRPVP